MQGSHCANVTITMEGAEVSPFLPGFSDRTQTTQVVCWHKITAQPKAKLAFDMCTNKKCKLSRGQQAQHAATAACMLTSVAFHRLPCLPHHQQSPSM